MHELYTVEREDGYDNIKVNLMTGGCEDDSQMEMAQHRVEIRILVLAMLNHQVLLAES
jgi:hypothetical protein